MRTTPLQRWLAGFTLLAVVLFSAFLWLKPLLNIGGGYAAKQACSCHFLQGRELDEISEHDLNFSVLGWYGLSTRPFLNEDALTGEIAKFAEALATEGPQVVTSSLWGLVERDAVYRPGYGCTLINANDEPAPGIFDLSFIMYPPLSAVSTSPNAPWRNQADLQEAESFFLTPRGSSGDVAEQRLSGAVRAALDYGMQAVPGGGARGIVVLQNGQLAGERYAPGFDRNSRLPGWSMTKTLTGLALGAYLSQDSSYNAVSFVEATDNLFPDLWRDKRSEITLADLMRMNSGLEWNEGYGSITDATVMLHEKADFADFAARHQLAETPGTVWNYSSGTTNILMDYLRRELGSNEALYTFLESLFTPIAPSLLIEADQSGRAVGSSYGWATTRDWARLGQFMLQDGAWNGDTLLPPGWIDFMREPATGSDGVYGAQTWLPGPDVPSLPADAYMMRGFQDQRVFVIPSKQLVIARLGHGDDKVTDFEGLISRILAALE